MNETQFYRACYKKLTEKATLGYCVNCYLAHKQKFKVLKHISDDAPWTYWNFNLICEQFSNVFNNISINFTILSIKLCNYTSFMEKFK